MVFFLAFSSLGSVRYFTLMRVLKILRITSLYPKKPQWSLHIPSEMTETLAASLPLSNRATGDNLSWKPYLMPNHAT